MLCPVITSRNGRQWTKTNGNPRKYGIRHFEHNNRPRLITTIFTFTS